MKATDAMISTVRAYAPAPCSVEQAHKIAQGLLALLAADGLLLEPFDPETWDGQMEPPVGWRVCDSQGDVWCHGWGGWGLRRVELQLPHSEWRGTEKWKEVLIYTPLVLVPGGQVPESDR